MADELFNGRRFRLLTIVDDFTRESLAIEVGQRDPPPRLVPVSMLAQRRLVVAAEACGA